MGQTKYQSNKSMKQKIGSIILPPGTNFWHVKTDKLTDTTRDQAESSELSKCNFEESTEWAFLWLEEQYAFCSYPTAEDQVVHYCETGKAEYWGIVYGSTKRELTLADFMQEGEKERFAIRCHFGGDPTENGADGREGRQDADKVHVEVMDTGTQEKMVRSLEDMGYDGWISTLDRRDHRMELCIFKRAVKDGLTMEGCYIYGRECPNIIHLNELISSNRSYLHPLYIHSLSNVYLLCIQYIYYMNAVTLSQLPFRVSPRGRPLRWTDWPSVIPSDRIYTPSPGYIYIIYFCLLSKESICRFHCSRDFGSYNC
ncbi:hypothetical protein BKA69DRAFT_294861 [Paraphysoderma sedebokerense]|nr:hypothetical protein BKA69DRAFT_294861 [Paraphysoderma sedebokerense]